MPATVDPRCACWPLPPDGESLALVEDRCRAAQVAGVLIHHRARPVTRRHQLCVAGTATGDPGGRDGALAPDRKAASLAVLDGGAATGGGGAVVAVIVGGGGAGGPGGGGGGGATVVVGVVVTVVVGDAITVGAGAGRVTIPATIVEQIITVAARITAPITTGVPVRASRISVGALSGLYG